MGGTVGSRNASAPTLVRVFALVALGVSLFFAGYVVRERLVERRPYFGEGVLPGILCGTWEPVDADSSAGELRLQANGWVAAFGSGSVAVEPWWTTRGERMRVENRKISGISVPVSVFSATLEVFDHDSGSRSTVPVRVEAWGHKDKLVRRLHFDTGRITGSGPIPADIAPEWRATD